MSEQEPRDPFASNPSGETLPRQEAEKQDVVEETLEQSLASLFANAKNKLAIRQVLGESIDRNKIDLVVNPEIESLLQKYITEGRFNDQIRNQLTDMVSAYKGQLEQEFAPSDLPKVFQKESYKSDINAHPESARILAEFVSYIHDMLQDEEFDPRLSLDEVMAGHGQPSIVRVKQALERLDVGQDNTLKVLTDLENYFLTTDYDLLRVSDSLEDREKAEILRRLYITNSDPKQIGSERLKRLLDERIRKLESDRIENLVGEKSKINSLVNLESLLKQVTSSNIDPRQLRLSIETELFAAKKDLDALQGLSEEDRKKVVEQLQKILIAPAEKAVAELRAKEVDFWFNRIEQTQEYKNFLAATKQSAVPGSGTQEEQIQELESLRSDLDLKKNDLEEFIKNTTPTDLTQEEKRIYEERRWKEIQKPYEDQAIQIESNLANLKLSEVTAMVGEINNVTTDTMLGDSGVSLKHLRDLQQKMSLKRGELANIFSELNSSSLAPLREKAAKEQARIRAAEVKLAELIAFAEKNPEKWSWEDLMAEVRRIVKDPYDYGYWRQPTADKEYPSKVRDEYMKRSQTRLEDEVADGRRAFEKIRFAAELIKDILGRGATVPEVKRSQLMNQLDRVLMTRSDMLRGSTMMPKGVVEDPENQKNNIKSVDTDGRKVRKMIKYLQRAMAKKDSEVGAEEGITYAYITAPQRDGEPEIEKKLKQKFPQYDSRLRDLARVEFILLDGLTAVLRDLQRKTQTPAHSDPDDINRLLIQDVFKHSIHTMFRYEGNEESPLLEHSVVLEEFPADWGADAEKRKKARKYQALLKKRLKIFLGDSEIETIPAMPVGTSFFPDTLEALNIMPGESLSVGDTLYGRDQLVIGRIEKRIITNSGNRIDIKKIVESGKTKQDPFTDANVPIMNLLDAAGNVIGTINDLDKKAYSIPGDVVMSGEVKNTEQGTFLVDNKGNKTHTIKDGIVFSIKIEDGEMVRGEKVGYVRNIVTDANGQEIGTVISDIESSRGERLGTSGEEIEITQTLLINGQQLPQVFVENGHYIVRTVKRNKVLLQDKGEVSEVVKNENVNPNIDLNDLTSEETIKNIAKIKKAKTREIREEYKIKGLGIKAEDKVPLDFDGQLLGELKYGDLFVSGQKQGTYDERLVYDLDENVIGFLSSQAVDDQGDVVGHVLPEVFDSKGRLLSNPGELRALGAERNVKISLDGQLATWELYGIAEKGVMYIAKLIVEKLPEHVNEHFILGSAESGKSGGAMWKISKEGFGMTKVFKGPFYDYAFVPYMELYITRLLHSAEEIAGNGDAYARLWHGIVHSLEEAKSGTGVAEFSLEIDEVIQWMKGPKDRTVYSGISEGLRPWYISARKHELLRDFLNDYFELKGKLEKDELPKSVDKLSEIRYRNNQNAHLAQQYNEYFDIINRKKPIPDVTAREFSQFEKSQKD